MVCVLVCVIAGCVLGWVEAGYLAAEAEKAARVAAEQAGDAEAAGLDVGLHARVFAAGLTGVLGAVVGLLGWCGALLARRTGATRAVAGAVRRLVPATADDRAGVVRLYAVALASVLACAGFAVAALFVIRRNWTLQIQEFAVEFTAGLVVAMAIATAAAIAIVAPLLRRPLDWLGRRRRIPLAPPGLLYAILVAAPVVAIAGPFTSEHRAHLGQALATGLWSAVIATLAGALYAGWIALPRRWPRIRVGVGGALSLVWVAGVVFTVTSWPDHPAEADAASASVGAIAGGDLLRLVSDVDRDGASSWLGGGDCAPLDGDRSPNRDEIPRNDIDENCDGIDPKPLDRSEVVPAPQYADALPPARYNIVWLSIDAVRADHVGAYGYDKPTTPYLDGLAREAVLFERAYAQSSRTFFSIPSMFIGRNPASITWERGKKVQQPVDHHTTLAERLTARGYKSGIFLSGGVWKHYTGLQPGFDEAHSYYPDPDDRKTWRSRSSPIATQMAIEFVERALANHGDRPFFVAVHYIAPHAPYTKHDEAYPDFLGDDTGRNARKVARYDGDLAYVDRYVGFLLEYLRHREGVWDDTVIVVTSDHGEAFGEHGRTAHGWDCHRESVHVPLLLRVPGLAPRRVETPVALIDLAPTVTELVGASRDPATFEGQSLLVPIFHADEVDPDRPLFCTTASVRGRRFLTRAVRAGRHLLTQDVRHQAFSLYDTHADPGEHNDRLMHADHRDVGQQLKRLLSWTETGNLRDYW